MLPIGKLLEKIFGNSLCWQLCRMLCLQVVYRFCWSEIHFWWHQCNSWCIQVITIFLKLFICGTNLLPVLTKFIFTITQRFLNATKSRFQTNRILREPGHNTVHDNDWNKKKSLKDVMKPAVTNKPKGHIRVVWPVSRTVISKQCQALFKLALLFTLFQLFPGRNYIPATKPKQWILYSFCSLC